MQVKIILLVEDDPNDVELILRSLKKYNISNRVTVVSDGQEALDYLFAGGAYANLDKEAMPAVVLLDIKLPKIDGIEVLRRLRADERTKFLPVVMLTSSKEQQDLVNSYKYGCNSYVRKPIEFDELVEAVSKLGLYWLLINEAPPHIRELK
jgi:CheY-like chemotaxis protein